MKKSEMEHHGHISSLLWKKAQLTKAQDPTDILKAASDVIFAITGEKQSELERLLQESGILEQLRSTCSAAYEKFLSQELPLHQVHLEEEVHELCEWLEEQIILLKTKNSTSQGSDQMEMIHEIVMNELYSVRDPVLHKGAWKLFNERLSTEELQDGLLKLMENHLVELQQGTAVQTSE